MANSWPTRAGDGVAGVIGYAIICLAIPATSMLLAIATPVFVLSGGRVDESGSDRTAAAFRTTGASPVPKSANHGRDARATVW
jgi:hypothetical protein